MDEESELVRCLRGEVVFEGPVLTRKVLGVNRIQRDDGERRVCSYDAPVDDKVILWAERNALNKLFGDSLHKPGYLFFGANRVLCVLTPTVATLRDTSEKQDYQWSVNLRYHPRDEEIPFEIEGALTEMGFKRKIS